jgi:phosphohistidine phosphatase
MELFLVRHAIAEEPREGLEDAERALTPRGRSRFKRAARGLARLGVDLKLLLYSPWRRAAETAELLGRLAPERASTELLARPPDDELLALVASKDAPRLGLVGHEPWLSELAGWLLVGERRGFLALKKGGVIWLSGEPTPGGMQLRAFYTPRVLRAVR